MSNYNLAELLLQQLSTSETSEPLKLNFSDLLGLTYSKNAPVAPVNAKIEVPAPKTNSEIAQMAGETFTQNNATTEAKSPTKLGKAFGKSLSLANTVGGQIATKGLGLINSALENKNLEYTGKTSETINAVSGAAEKLSSTINPLGSGIVSLGKNLGQKIGGQNASGAGSAAVNTVSQALGYLGPVGWVAGGALNLINGAFGGRTRTLNDLSSQFSSDFTGSQSLVSSTIDKYSGKKYGLFDIGMAKKGNRRLNEADRIQDAVLKKQEFNQQRMNNNVDYTSRNLNKYYSGNQQLSLAKQGMKFPDLETARNILNSIKSKDIQSFKSGGKIEKENIIPTGALHKNLHHIEENAPELEGKITKKGIPVGTYSEGGEFLQQAEVESHEWTMSLDSTKKVEEYHENYKETGDDNIAIDCGKFLVDQIFNNTRDDDKVIKKTE